MKRRKEKKHNTNPMHKSVMWAAKITCVTLALSLVVSFITELTSSKSNLVISFLMLTLLIIISIIFDTIGVAATSCDIRRLLDAEIKKIKGAENAVKLVKNAEKVANICSDVIGDMCATISGACAAAIVIIYTANNPKQYVFNIIMSSLVAAVTVGGKAVFKLFAINKSQDIMLMCGKMIGVFLRKK